MILQESKSIELNNEQVKSLDEKLERILISMDEKYINWFWHTSVLKKEYSKEKAKHFVKEMTYRRLYDIKKKLEHVYACGEEYTINCEDIEFINNSEERMEKENIKELKFDLIKIGLCILSLVFLWYL